VNPLSSTLQNAISSSRGIEGLYNHQAKAINELSMGKHVIVSTATASGKSLVYQIPVLAALEQDPTAKALYIFPTKALAQDQKRSLLSILSQMPGLSHVQVETFDGDTPQSNRTQIRETASGMSFCCTCSLNNLKLYSRIPIHFMLRYCQMKRNGVRFLKTSNLLWLMVNWWEVHI
jgi:superfamily II DNA/RNA helicase